jgi:hypothetical protein
LTIIHVALASTSGGGHLSDGGGGRYIDQIHLQVKGGAVRDAVVRNIKPSDIDLELPQTIQRGNWQTQLQVCLGLGARLAWQLGRIHMRGRIHGNLPSGRSIFRAEDQSSERKINLPSRQFSALCTMLYQNTPLRHIWPYCAHCCRDSDSRVPS